MYLFYLYLFSFFLSSFFLFNYYYFFLIIQKKIIKHEKKRLFDENIYVIYQYESFRDNNSSIIPDFCKNFPQIELFENEKQ